MNPWFRNIGRLAEKWQSPSTSSCKFYAEIKEKKLTKLICFFRFNLLSFSGCNLKDAFSHKHLSIGKESNAKHQNSFMSAIVINICGQHRKRCKPEL